MRVAFKRFSVRHLRPRRRGWSGGLEGNAAPGDLHRSRRSHIAPRDRWRQAETRPWADKPSISRNRRRNCLELGFRSAELVPAREAAMSSVGDARGTDGSVDFGLKGTASAAKQSLPESRGLGFRFILVCSGTTAPAW